MYNEELDTDVSSEALITETKTCPRCKCESPSLISCGTCGYPLESEQEEKKTKLEGISFDLERLKEIQGEIITSKKEESIMLQADKESVETELKFAFEPVEKESLSNNYGFKENKTRLPNNALDVANTNSSKGIDLLRKGEEHASFEDQNSGIESLATELFNSIYMELWSVNLFRSSEIDEEKFVEVFEGYHNRLENCIGVRDDLLDQIKDLEPYEEKIREASIELEKLEVRKNLGDLHEGEYNAMVPALKWAINFNRDEIKKLQNRIALLENPLSLISSEKITQIAVSAEEVKDFIREAEAFAKLGQSTAAVVSDHIKKIQKIIKTAS